ncbi:MAG: M90 family metallopeptidase [Rhodoferax sp.]|nr:M90 family metallopeptidase [Rhodoferax sp.]
MAFLVFCVAALMLLAGLLGYPRWQAWRRLRLQQQPFPAVWRKVLRKRVPLVARLPVDLQLQLKKHMQVFVAEKVFIGCAGLQVTDEMRVVVAAQACLLLLNRPLRGASDYFAGVRQILMYPGAFVVNRSVTDAAGLQQDQRQTLAGESWSQGQVILSWQDTVEGAADAHDGRNVVIHEFAHQLDQENGQAVGAPLPVFGDAAHNAKRWMQVFSEAFAQLQGQAFMGEQGVLNHYGAQDPAEFFAVATEAFFEQGRALRAEQPALYAELQAYFKVNPATW